MSTKRGTLHTKIRISARMSWDSEIFDVEKDSKTNAGTRSVERVAGVGPRNFLERRRQKMFLAESFSTHQKHA